MNTPDPKPYNHFGDYLKARFGGRVHKITVDAGFTCPNRDGSVARGGCTFCNNEGFSANSRDNRSQWPVARQIEQGMDWARRRFKARKFLVYFQAYTNTYAPTAHLKQLYDHALVHPDIIGLDIGTRPDCVNEEILDLVESYCDPLEEVWIEYGLQSSHDRTLERINRGHDYASFLRAIELSANRRFKVCVHVILGLPGETAEDMMETCDRLAGLPIHGLKIHLLHLLEGTALVKEWKRGDLRLLEREEYVRLVCDHLERIPEHFILHRVTGEAPPGVLIGPEWCLDKSGVLQDIHTEMHRRGTVQGSRFMQGVTPAAQ